MYISSLPYVPHSRPPHLSDLFSRIIFREEYKPWKSHYEISSSSLLPRPSPLHPILEQPLPMSHPQCERPSFTPIQNNRQNYRLVYSYFNLYIFGQQTDRQKIMHRMVAGISGVESSLNFFINTILICSHIFQFFQASEWYMTSFCVLMLSCILFMRHEHIILSIYFQVDILTNDK